MNTVLFRHKPSRTLKSLRLLFLLALGFFSSCLTAQEINVLDFGAVADGKTLSTEAFQKSIDQSSKSENSRVIVPKGRFLVGTIILPSNVEIYLAEGAELLGSTNPDHYQKINRWKAILLADDAENIKISGKGKINGQGTKLALHIDSLFYAGKIDSSDYNFGDKRPKVTIRPQLIEMVNCKNIEISGITLEAAASWVQSYFRCTNLTIDGIRVESDTYWNNDGIDIIDCKKVRLTNSYFNSSDDGICLKSYAGGYSGKQDWSFICDSIYIANCTVRSSASALKFGTASYRGFKNILIENIKVFDTYRSVIALESISNGMIENVTIRNIEATNTGNALFIRLGGEIQKDRKGYFKNVLIENVQVEIAKDIPDKEYIIRGPALPFFHNTFPSSITGVPNNIISGIRLRNIQIDYPGGGKSAYANLPVDRLDQVPELPKDYPEFSMFGELPAWGLYIRHAEGIEIENLKLRIQEEDYRPAVVLDDVKRSNFYNFEINEIMDLDQIYENNTTEVNWVEN